MECWGLNEYGQTTVSPDVQYEQIVAGHEHTCGLRSDTRRVECWGGDHQGQANVNPDVPYGKFFVTCRFILSNVKILRVSSNFIECDISDTLVHFSIQNNRLISIYTTELERC